MTPGVSRPVPCMTEPVSKLFVASVNFVLWHWDCFVKNFLIGQIKVCILRVMKLVVIVNQYVNIEAGLETQRQ